MNPSQFDDNLDRARLLELVDGDEELLEEIIQLFVSEAPELLGAMQNALDRGDMTALSRTAHSMKGAVANFWAQGAASAASQLEQDAKTGGAEAAKISFAALQQSVERLLHTLREISQETSK